jgi:hypothetical protein
MANLLMYAGTEMVTHGVLAHLDPFRQFATVA